MTTPRETKRRDWRHNDRPHRPWRGQVPAHRLTPQQRLDIPNGLTPDEERSRYFHDVGMASRIRIHRELATEHTHCPYCQEELTR